MPAPRIVVVVAALAALLVAAGCAGAGPATGVPVVEVDAVDALVDRPVHIRVTGLAPGEEVEVALAAEDVDGVPWRSAGQWTADGAGVVDLREDAPVDGSYTGVDGMGLFWSMAPAGATDRPVLVPPGDGDPVTLRLAVRSGDRERAAADLVRRRVADGVVARVLTTAADGVAGVLFAPAAGAPPRPPVLALGGSGGEPMVPMAGLLASHGAPTLALDHVGGPGLPPTLEDVPLEYIADAARLLQREAGTDAPVAVVGYSRGTEAALLLAARHPDLVRSTVLYAPSDAVWPAYPPPGAAWTVAGEPVPTGPIPVGGVAGPVLAVAGGRDRVWDSSAQASRLAAALAAAGVEHEVLRYPDAGHGVGTHPHLAVAPQGPDAATRAADAAARADGWPRVLEFLAREG